MRLVTAYAIVATVLVGVLGYALVTEVKHEAVLEQQLIAARRPVAVVAKPASVAPSDFVRREAEVRRTQRDVDDLVYEMHRLDGDSPTQAAAAVSDARRSSLTKPKH